MDLELVVVLALASYRVSRLVTQDTVTANLRGALFGWAWDEEHPITVGSGKDAQDRKSTRLNSSHIQKSRMPSSA